MLDFSRLCGRLYDYMGPRRVAIEAYTVLYGTGLHICPIGPHANTTKAHNKHIIVLMPFMIQGFHSEAAIY